MQESDGGAIYRVSNYPDLLSEMPRYCCPLVILIEILLQFRTACQDHQAGESAVKCLSQGHNRMAQVGFEPRDHADHQSGALTTRHFEDDWSKK